MASQNATGEGHHFSDGGTYLHQGSQWSRGDEASHSQVKCESSHTPVPGETFRTQNEMEINNNQSCMSAAVGKKNRKEQMKTNHKHFLLQSRKMFWE